MSYRYMYMVDYYLCYTSVHFTYSYFIWWFVMMACIIFMIINITGFIIIIVRTLMEPLMYLCDGHMVYEYSFLVDLDILSPLVQLVFSFRKWQDRYGSLGFLVVDLPGENGNKAQWRKNQVLLGRYRDSWGAASRLYHTTRVMDPSVQCFHVSFWSLKRYGLFYVPKANILIIKNG